MTDGVDVEVMKRLTPSQIEFIRAQPVFFVATAAREGRVNVSPRGRIRYESLTPDEWCGLSTMLFFRGMFASLFLALYLAYVYRGRSRDVLGQISWSTVAATAASTPAMICNLGACRNTSVANVVLIYATAPLVAATIDWGVLKEPFKRHALIASIASLVGVTIMVLGSTAGGGLLGDLGVGELVA